MANVEKTVGNQQAGLTEREFLECALRIARISIESPREIDRRLGELGYCGQTEARKAGSILCYRHLARLRAHFLRSYAEAQQDSATTIPSRRHTLFAGPSGSGKTHLIELLFEKILKIPTVMEDATKFSETAYVGRDVESMLGDLYQNAERHRGWASVGCVFIDEIDKIAARPDTGRDVSGEGVQRGLLALLASRTSMFPDTSRGMPGRNPQLCMPLDNVLFIAAGAFTGVTTQGRPERMGFHAKLEGLASNNCLSSETGQDYFEELKSRGGLIPELLGRFQRVVQFKPLDRGTLKSILSGKVLVQWEEEYQREGIDLRIDNEVSDAIIDSALHRQLGARGLQSALAPVLESAAYDCFADKDVACVHIEMNNGQIVAREERRRCADQLQVAV